MTGEQVSPNALSRDVNRTAEEAAADARAQVDRLQDVPAFTGGVDLQATIKVMHGNETIASTEEGFEGAAEKFATWIAAQES